MKGLMLHCGSDALTREALGSVEVPKAIGSRHVTRPFIEDVELVSRFMDTVGLTIEAESYGVKFNKETGQAEKFFGLMQVSEDRGITSTSEYGKGYGLMVGLRGSYDQTLPRAVAVGSRVFVCDNLAFSGEVQIKTRQTLNIASRIPALLGDAVEQIPHLAQKQDQRFIAYRNTELKPRHGDAALIELVRRGALTASQLGRAIEEWDEPTHQEHAEQEYSVWRLHNAVTEAIKPANTARLALNNTWERTQVMTRFFDEVVGI